MQNNYSFGPIVGFLIFVVLGTAILTVGAAGTYGPQQQAVANRINAEVEYLRGKYAQELAASQAEINAAIANAPALAQLELDRQAQELAQQKRDFELNSGIKESIPYGILALTVAAAVIAAAYAASRTTGSIAVGHVPAESASGEHQARQPANPHRTLEASTPSGLRSRPATARPAEQPPSANGHTASRMRAYRQILERDHATTEQLGQQMTTQQNQICALSELIISVQRAVEQIATTMQARDDLLVTQIEDIQAALHQIDAVRTSEPKLIQNNGQEHAIDIREISRSSASHNGTHLTKEAPGQHPSTWRKAA